MGREALKVMHKGERRESLIVFSPPLLFKVGFEDETFTALIKMHHLLIKHRGLLTSSLL